MAPPLAYEATDSPTYDVFISHCKKADGSEDRALWCHDVFEEVRAFRRRAQEPARRLRLCTAHTCHSACGLDSSAVASLGAAPARTEDAGAISHVACTRLLFFAGS